MAVMTRNSGKRYVPILKTKAGELGALGQLAQQYTDVVPLLELHAIDPLKDLASLKKYAMKIKNATQMKRLIYFDGTYVGNYVSQGLGQNPSATLFNELSACGVSVIPVTDPYRSHYYNSASCGVAIGTGNGLCVRVNAWFLNSNKTQVYNDINLFLESCGTSVNSIDILLELGEIQQTLQSAPGVYIPFLVNEINGLSSLAPWREIILSGGSFPATLPGNSQTLFAVNRIEWAIWDQLRQVGELQRLPDYSDYTCLPVVHLPPAPYMAPAPKIRYAIDDRWLVAKGQSIKLGTPSQYYSLAQAIARRPEFCGAQFSFGDDYIAQRAGVNPPSTGYFTQWLTADVNHHITYVANQI